MQIIDIGELLSVEIKPITTKVAFCMMITKVWLVDLNDYVYTSAITILLRF